MPHNNQTSPIGFLSLKLPPPPCALLLASCGMRPWKVYAFGRCKGAQPRGQTHPPSLHHGNGKSLFVKPTTLSCRNYRRWWKRCFEVLRASVKRFNYDTSASWSTVNFDPKPINQLSGNPWDSMSSSDVKTRFYPPKKDCLKEGRWIPRTATLTSAQFSGYLNDYIQGKQPKRLRLILIYTARLRKIGGCQQWGSMPMLTDGASTCNFFEDSVVLMHVGMIYSL